MSASAFGEKLATQGRNVTNVMRDGVVTAGAPTGGVQGGAQAVQFERKFSAKDAMDDEMHTKMSLMDKDGMTPFGQVYYDDKVGKWLERKEAAVEAVNFDAYFNTQFNKNDLASRQWAQSINPEFYSTREQEMTAKAEVILKLKKIQLRGPQDKDDLHMLWLIESGRVNLPQDWDTLGPGWNGNAKPPTAANAFQEGLVRFPKFKNQAQRQQHARQNLQQGAWGSANTAINRFGSPATQAGGPNNKLNKDNTMNRSFLSYLK